MTRRVTKKQLDDFLPKKINRKLIQARIPVEVYDAVKKQIDRDRKNGVQVDWTSLVEAFCKVYLAERKAS
jgi:hypothetical protein